MYKFARLSNKDKDFVFNYVAIKKNLTNAIVEKDFWVCLTLDYLFNKSKYKDVFTFKGGTSLSKGFDLIKRFSEDIDLILDWRSLGVEKEEPMLERSNTKQDLFNQELNQKASLFIKEKLIEDMKSNLSLLLGIDVEIRVDEKDSQVVNFYYPKIYTSDAILQFIRLEIGPLAAWTPAKEVSISPFVVDFFMNEFDIKSANVLTVLPERTFWEKATILHAEANRPKDKTMPARYSRHYYDMYQLGHSEYKAKALQNIDLLQKVVTFKNKFYRNNWAKYEQALEGNIKLAPLEYRIQELNKDYDKMKEMIFEEAPDFDVILKYLRELEKEI